MRFSSSTALSSAIRRASRTASGARFCVEEPRRELDEQDVADGPVDVLHVERTLPDQPLRVPVLLASGFEIDARLDGHAGRLLSGGSHAVEVLEHPDRTPVGVDIAPESEAVAQQPGHQGLRPRDRLVVIGAVAVHGGQRLRCGDQLPERLDVQAHQLPFSALHRSQVEPGRGRAVRDEVLGSRNHALRVHGRHIGGSHARNQVRVLAERLLDTSPAQLAGHVEHGGEHLLRTDGLHLVGDVTGHPADELRIEGRPLRNGLREDGAAVLHHAVQPLHNGDDRNPETGVAAHVGLDPPHGPQVLSGGVGERLDAAPAHTAGRGRQLFEVGLSPVVVMPAMDVPHLREFFAQGHPPQQVVRTLPGRAAPVPVGRTYRKQHRIDFGEQLPVRFGRTLPSGAGP